MYAFKPKLKFLDTEEFQRENDGLEELRLYLMDEAHALSFRLDEVKPFSLTMPMVTAASLPRKAQQGIDELIREGKRELRIRLNKFVEKIRSGALEEPEEAQKAFAFLKLRFNALLDQLDIFADVISQRSEHHTGVWLSGLDALVQDALVIDAAGIPKAPLVCFLERGHGAAIRKARTRLPGGKSNPVGVIQVPRERMVSNGIASSLVHEVGHQGAAMLEILKPLKKALYEKGVADPGRALAWQLFDRWISEIVADYWAVAMLGVCGTTGLMGVVSLPRYFMFRIQLDDPHPFPWIRVKISLAFGRLLYPDEQWERLEHLWHQIYPTDGLTEDQKKILGVLEAVMPEFTGLIAGFRLPLLQGQPLNTLFPISRRQPNHLREIFQKWKQSPSLARKARPSLVFAVIGQARTDRKISPGEENKWLRQILTFWAQQHHVIH